MVDALPVGICNSETFKNIPEELLCTICYEPSTDWRSSGCKDGQHSFCNGCIRLHIDTCNGNNTRPFCPSCKDPVVFSNTINNTYELKTVRKLNAITLEQIVECPEGCGESMCLAKLKMHIEKGCPNATVKCSMQKYGCTHTCKRNELDAHMKAESHSFLAIPVMIAKAETFENENAALKDDINKLSGIVSSLVSTMDSMKTEFEKHVKAQAETNKVTSGVKTALDECIEDDEYGLKKIAEQTKKRAAKGAPSTKPRTIRQRRQVDQQKEDLQRMEKELDDAKTNAINALASSSSSSAPAPAAASEMDKEEEQLDTEYDAMEAAAAEAAAEAAAPAAAAAAAPAAAAAAAASGSSSPDPSYSPTSPVYSPTSPQYNDEDVDNQTRKKRLPVDDNDSDWD